MPSNSSASPYGEWNPAGAPFRIRYSHSLLQEIDFCTADGYRRIPHGGLEVGGLLYGPVEDGVVTLVACQAIECEHSTGPSFALSELDVERLVAQIRQPFCEKETELPVAGWFISHCRGELAMTQQEVDLFAELFPEPHCVTLLVKPEKFKATQYGFLARTRNGTLQDRRCAETFLLPLAARESAGTAPSVPEPPSRPYSRRALRGSSSVQAQGSEAETFLTSPSLSESSIPTGPGRPAPDSAARGGVWGHRRAAPEPKVGRLPRPVALGPKKPLESSPTGFPAPFAGRSSATESTAPAKLETGLEAEQDEIDQIEPPTFGMKKAVPGNARPPFGMKVSLAAMLVIALLMAVAWTCLNFMLRPIPLAAESRAGKLVITWPAVSTDGANEKPWLEAWVDGRPSSRQLTSEEQERGEMALDGVGTDVIVQLRVHHWFYERSGMIRWIQVPPVPSAPPAAAKTARR
jgi:hypothetical protein